jgi:hypothetical protein
VVRGVGPCVPLRDDRARRPGVRQGAAPAHSPRLVPASGRPDPGVRVGIRRREPAGACLGRPAGVRSRQRHRHRLPEPGDAQAAAELHLVGQSQGPGRQQRLRGRFPRPRQRRPVRPVGRAAGRRQPPTIRCDRLDGHVRAEPAGDRAAARPPRSRVRGRGHEVLRTLRLHRQGGKQALGRRRRVLLRRAPAGRRRRATDAHLLGGRARAALRDHEHALGRAARPTRSRGAHLMVPRPQARVRERGGRTPPGRRR